MKTIADFPNLVPVQMKNSNEWYNGQLFRLPFEVTYRPTTVMDMLVGLRSIGVAMTPSDGRTAYVVIAEGSKDHSWTIMPTNEHGKCLAPYGYAIVDNYEKALEVVADLKPGTEAVGLSDLADDRKSTQH